MKRLVLIKNLNKLITCLCLFIALSIIFIPLISNAAVVTQQVKSGIENFPESYKQALYELKALHPNWNFDAYYTGIDWNDLINAEKAHKVNVVPTSSESSWKCKTCTASAGWICASEDIIKYYIDPRNFLNEVNIFQFQELSYNSSIHTLESVQKLTVGTFLNNSVTFYSEEKGKNVTMAYSEIILEAAKKYNVSPFHIRSKIIQEVGVNGSGSVSGTYSGYEGYYNFFNYGAYDTGNAVQNALIYAKNKGWDNPYKSIMGGVSLMGSTYINVRTKYSIFF